MDDVGFQRAIYASIQMHNAMQRAMIGNFAPPPLRAPAPTRQTTTTVTRSMPRPVISQRHDFPPQRTSQHNGIAPTVPSTRGVVPRRSAPGDRGALAREGIVPATRTSGLRNHSSSSTAVTRRSAARPGVTEEAGAPATPKRAARRTPAMAREGGPTVQAWEGRTGMSAQLTEHGPNHFAFRGQQSSCLQLRAPPAVPPLHRVLRAPDGRPLIEGAMLFPALNDEAGSGDLDPASSSIIVGFLTHDDRILGLRVRYAASTQGGAALVASVASQMLDDVQGGTSSDVSSVVQVRNAQASSTAAALIPFSVMLCPASTPHGQARLVCTVDNTAPSALKAVRIPAADPTVLPAVPSAQRPVVPLCSGCSGAALRDLTLRQGHDADSDGGDSGDLADVSTTDARRLPRPSTNSAASPLRNTPARQGVGVRSNRQQPSTAAQQNKAPAAAPSAIDAMVEAVERDMLDHKPNVQWEDIAACEDAKRLLNEAVVLPLVVPELFTGLRQPWKGVLLFGPPGTGKTMLAKAVATAGSTSFYCASASSIVSRYHGESEKMVKALFTSARANAPATIFIDEVDSIMQSRSAGGGGSDGQEATRRMKAEVLQQIDGVPSAATTGDDGQATSVPPRVMVLCTTNTPWDLDDAMIRRLEKRIYIPLPDQEGRQALLALQAKATPLHPAVDLGAVAAMTDGFSGADLMALSKEAAMAPMRRVVDGKSPAEIVRLKQDGGLDGARLVVEQSDYEAALARVRPSVPKETLARFEEWAREHGST